MILDIDPAIKTISLLIAVKNSFDLSDQDVAALLRTNAVLERLKPKPEPVDTDKNQYLKKR